MYPVPENVIVPEKVMNAAARNTEVNRYGCSLPGLAGFAEPLARATAAGVYIDSEARSLFLRRKKANRGIEAFSAEAPHFTAGAFCYSTPVSDLAYSIG